MPPPHNVFKITCWKQIDQDNSRSETCGNLSSSPKSRRKLAQSLQRFNLWSSISRCECSKNGICVNWGCIPVCDWISSMFYILKESVWEELLSEALARSYDHWENKFRGQGTWQEQIQKRKINIQKNERKHGKRNYSCTGNRKEFG